MGHNEKNVLSNITSHKINKTPFSYLLFCLILVIFYSLVIFTYVVENDLSKLIFNFIGFICWIHILYNYLLKRTFIFEKIDSPIVGILTNDTCLMCNKKRKTIEHLCIFCFIKNMKSPSPENDEVIAFLKNIKEKYGEDEAQKIMKTTVVSQLLREYANENNDDHDGIR